MRLDCAGRKGKKRPTELTDDGPSYACDPFFNPLFLFDLRSRVSPRGNANIFCTPTTFNHERRSEGIFMLKKYRLCSLMTHRARFMTSLTEN